MYFITRRIKISFIWYIPYLTPLCICLQSPDILVAILHSWDYLWRNRGNKKALFTVIRSRPLPQKKKTSSVWYGMRHFQGSWLCLVAGFSSYFGLLKSLIPCTLLQISWREPSLTSGWSRNEFLAVKSRLASDRFNNEKQLRHSLARQFVILLTFYLLKSPPKSPGRAMPVVEDGFTDVFKTFSASQPRGQTQRETQCSVSDFYSLIQYLAQILVWLCFHLSSLS